MIPKIDENPPIQDSAPPQTSPQNEKKALRRSGKLSAPPLQRCNSDASIDSTAVIPTTIVTTTESPLHESALSTRISPPRSTAKAVCFNKRVRIRKIKRLEDMTEDEVEATYYTEDELMDIRNDLRSKIRSMVESNYKEDQEENVNDYDSKSTTFCVRGLEHEFPQGKLRRKQLKMMSRGAVLEEQRLQRQFRVGRTGKSFNSISSHSTSTASTLCTFDSSINSTQHVVDEDADAAISEIYRIESKPAVQLALEMAKRDELIADQIYFAHQAI